MDMKAIRFQNLELLIDEYGAAEVARKADSSPAYISQLKTKRRTPKGTKIRGIGDDIARRLEKGFGKPEGWMDQIHYKPSRQKYHRWLDCMSEDEFREFEKVANVMKVFKRFNEEEKADPSEAPLSGRPGKSA